VETVLGIGLANAVLAALLAVGAAVVTMAWRRPALAHALWALVLLKLLTPPIWGFSVERFYRSFAPARAVEPREPAAPAAPARTVEPLTTPLPIRSRGQTHTLVRDGPFRRGALDRPLQGLFSPASCDRSVDVDWRTYAYIFVEDQPGAAAATTLASPATPPPSAPILWPPVPASAPTMRSWFVRWSPLLGTIVWLTGSATFASLICVRVVRFRRMLRFATPAPEELQCRAAALARRMGLASAPPVWFLPGAVCPMLWEIGGGPRLLMPQGLWDTLGEGQRSSVLAHELAHLRRRDHWIRLIELAATVLYWWCPVTWWARRRLRESEEQCCDAWVVWLMPGSGREYASALLEAVDFVSKGKDSGAFGPVPAVPVLASGMGQFHQLKRRLVMIKNAKVPRSLSWRGWLAVCTLGAALLPLAPSWAEPPQTVANDPGFKQSIEVTPVPIVVQPAVAAAPAPQKFAVVKTEVPVEADLNIDVDRRDASDAAEVAAAKESKLIDKLKKNSDQKPDRSGPQYEEAARWTATDAKLHAEREALRAEVKNLTKQLEAAQRRLDQFDAAMEKYNSNRAANKGPQTPDKANEFARSGRSPLEAPPLDFKGKLPLRDGSSDSSSAGKRSSTDADERSREKRLAKVEANLRELMDEVRELRNENRNKDKDKHTPGSAPKSY
jgi:bla regulator protein BlaR1